MAIKKSNNTKIERTRNWTFLVYPVEGNPPAPVNWRDILDEEHIQWVESPLHDKDINPDGSDKKAHIHILLMYDGVKTFEQVKKLTDKLNSPVPQSCSSARGLVRYMIHMDNPEKYQYERRMIIGHGGADVEEYLKPTSSSRYELIREMRQWVDEENCIEFYSLFNYAAENRFDDWFPLLCDNSAYIMGEFIRSRRNYFLDKDNGSLSCVGLSQHCDENQNGKDNEKCCLKCGSVCVVKGGKTRAQSQIWRCKDCGNRFVF